MDEERWLPTRCPSVLGKCASLGLEIWQTSVSFTVLDVTNSAWRSWSLHVIGMERVSARGAEMHLMHAA